MLENIFSIFSSQEISSGSVSFQMIFEAPQSELVKVDFYLPEPKLKKIPELNLRINYKNSIRARYRVKVANPFFVTYNFGVLVTLIQFPIN